MQLPLRPCGGDENRFPKSSERLQELRATAVWRIRWFARFDLKTESRDFNHFWFLSCCRHWRKHLPWIYDSSGGRTFVPALGTQSKQQIVREELTQRFCNKRQPKRPMQKILQRPVRRLGLESQVS